MDRPIVIDDRFLTTRLSARRTLVSAGLAHALHDGLTSSIYVLLPLWQTQFALSFSSLAALRAIYVGALAGLQIPAVRLSRHVGIPTMLAVGTVISACGFALGGMAGGLLGLAAALALAGAGGSTQHPLASAAVTQAYGEAARGPLGAYNFAGDLGKAALPPAMAIIISTYGNREALFAMAACSVVVALLLLRFMPKAMGALEVRNPALAATLVATHKYRAGFRVLLSIGILDNAVGVGLLLLLPKILEAKGASPAVMGTALSLVFIGGACGKAVCGWLAARSGPVAIVIVTEVGTAFAIMALIALPITPGLGLLPFLGVMLNGTSSVLYGTVPEFAGARPKENAFAVFYTCSLGSSAIAPLLYGLIGDAAGPTMAVVATGATALAVVPLVLILSASLLGDKPASA